MKGNKMTSRFLTLLLFLFLSFLPLVAQEKPEAAPGVSAPSDKQDEVQPMADVDPDAVEQNPALSRNAAKKAWQYFYQGKLETAMRRFNQAYMFDPENAEVFWGFGLILGQRALQQNTEGNLLKAIQLLERSLQLEEGPAKGKIQSDLALSYLRLGLWYEQEGDSKKSQANLAQAGKLFAVAYQTDPRYPPIMANYSLYYYYTGNWQEAEKLARAAIQAGYQFDPNYLADLKAASSESPSSNAE